MVAPSVVILSSRSLFVEGVASRLRQQAPAVLTQTVDAAAPDALAQVVAHAPQAVILDATDENVAHYCPLNALFNALPTIKVVRLDPQQKMVQVVTSQQHQAEQVSDLLQVLTT